MESSLDHSRSGDHLRVVSVPADLAPGLAAEGVAPGTRLEVESIVPLGGPVIVLRGPARVALGRAVAKTIVVEPIP